MRITLLILLTLFSNIAFAGVYKCTDSNGKKIYQNKPCADFKNATEFDPTTGTSKKIIDSEKQQLLEDQKILQQKADKLRKQQEQQKKQQQLELKILAESQKNQAWIKNNPGNYSAFAIPPYAENKHPDFADNFTERLPEIERFRRLGSEITLAIGKCGRVESAELNQRSTRTNLVFLINCSSGESFLLDEMQILQANP